MDRGRCEEKSVGDGQGAPGADALGDEAALFTRDGDVHREYPVTELPVDFLLVPPRQCVSFCPGLQLVQAFLDLPGGDGTDRQVTELPLIEPA